MTNRDEIAAILGAWEARRLAGERLDPESLLREHPEHANELRAELDRRLGALDALEAALDDGPTEPPAVPAEIGDYRIVQEIGRGGMGVVYEAEQISMGRRVALKVLTPSLTGTRRAVQRFQREAKAAGCLHHTNIVPVYGMGQQGGYWYYAMELVQGRPLNAVLKEMQGVEVSGRSERGLALFSSSNGNDKDATSSHGDAAWFACVAQAFAGVAEALHAAHEEGVVHRDVKPANLLLDADGTLKIVDFGLAHLDQPGPTMTLTGDLLGTPAYMSPEQAMAKRIPIDRRTDVYSLGATLYEVLTLRPPFDGRTLQALCSQIITKDPWPPRRLDGRIPRDLETIVLKAMEKDRDRRYQRAEDLADDLRQFAHGAAIAARRVGIAERAWRRVKRHRLVSTLVAALVLVGLGGVWLAMGKAAAEAEQRRLEYERLLALAEETRSSTFRPKRRLAGRPGAAFVSASSSMLSGGRWSAKELLTEAVKTDPDRPEAYWLRSLVSDRTRQERLADIDAAEQRGLSARTASLLRAHVSIDEELDDRAIVVSATDGQPTALDAYLEARISSRARDRERALELLDDAIERAPPGGIVVCLARIHRADLHLQADAPRRALEDLIFLREHGAEGVWVAPRIATVWRQLGDVETADAECKKILESVESTGSPDQWLALLRTLLKWGELEWFDRAMHRAIDQLGESADLLAQQAFRQKSTGPPEPSTLDLCHRALELDPDHQLALRVLACELMRMGQPKEALAHFLRAVDLKKSATNYHNLGAVCFELGDLEEAHKWLSKSLGLRPNSPDTKWNIGSVYARQRNWELATACFREAIELGHDDPGAEYCLGNAYFQGGKLEEAIAWLEKAVVRDSTDATSYLRLAQAVRSAGDLDRAIGHYRKARELAPENGAIHGDVGYALANAGFLKEGIETLRKGRTLDPKHPTIRYLLAIALFRRGRMSDLDEAIVLNRTVAPMVRGSPLKRGQALRNLAISLCARGHYQEALEKVREAHGVGAGQPGWIWDAAKDVDHIEARLTLERRLPGIVSGTDAIESAEQAHQLAEVAFTKSRSALSARMYEDAFATDPAHAGEENGAARQSAAAAAALAGCGRGEDAAELDENARAAWRAQAQTWLRENLAEYLELPANDPRKRPMRGRMESLLTDPDLSGVRDPEQLDCLPEEEARLWREYWSDLREALRQTSGDADGAANTEREVRSLGR